MLRYKMMNWLWI